MKNMKRALRRHQKHTKFLKRLRSQVHPQENWGEYHKRNKEDIIKEALEGKDTCYNKLRSMSTRCSCSMCAYLKYDRKEYRKDTLRILADSQK